MHRRQTKLSKRTKKSIGDGITKRCTQLFFSAGATVKTSERTRYTRSVLSPKTSHVTWQRKRKMATFSTTLRETPPEMVDRKKKKKSDLAEAGSYPLN